MSAGQRSLRLRKVSASRIDIDHLVDGYPERTVAVIRDARGTVFPEPMLSDAGLSLGSDAADGHARELARVEWVRFDALYTALRGRPR